MKTWQINPLVWTGLFGVLTIGTGFFIDLHQAFRGEQNIWWTNRDKGLSIELTQDAFELYVAGMLLQKRLEGRDLFLADDEGITHPVLPGDISVRLNNWERRKASLLTRTTVSGFFFGAAFALLIVGLFPGIGELKKKDERDNAPFGTDTTKDSV